MLSSPNPPRRRTGPGRGRSWPAPTRKRSAPMPYLQYQSWEEEPARPLAVFLPAPVHSSPVVLQWLSAPSRHSLRHQESSTQRCPTPSAGSQSLAVVRLFSCPSPFARCIKKGHHSFQTGALASNPRTRVCADPRSEEHTSELQSPCNLVC